MAEIQFAAGATSVMPVHDEGDGYAALGAARAAIAAFDLRPRATTIVSAHVMGGCALGADPRHAVVDETGRASPSRQSVCAGRFTVSDVGRRESATVDLRVDDEARDVRLRSACGRDEPQPFVAQRLV